jgi:uncharacterized protein YcnI
MKRTLLALLGVALLAAPAAAAHVTANPTQAPAGGFAMISFRVPHGCDDSPTTKLTVRIPEGVVSVTPQAVPGWSVKTTSGRLSEPVELHGETVTEGVKTVTWTGGPLDPHQFVDFGISMALPDQPEGTMLYFPAIQECAEGVTRWIQIPVEGEAEPEEPAPGVELTAAESHEEDTAATSNEDAMASSDSSAENEESDADMDRANLALGFAVGGLAVGLAALGMNFVRRRRES